MATTHGALDLEVVEANEGGVGAEVAIALPDLVSRRVYLANEGDDRALDVTEDESHGEGGCIAWNRCCGGGGGCAVSKAQQR